MTVEQSAFSEATHDSHLLEILNPTATNDQYKKLNIHIITSSQRIEAIKEKLSTDDEQLYFCELIDCNNKQHALDRPVVFCDWKTPDFISTPRHIAKGTLPFSLFKHTGKLYEEVPKEDLDEHPLFPIFTPPYRANTLDSENYDFIHSILEDTSNSQKTMALKRLAYNLYDIRTADKAKEKFEKLSALCETRNTPNSMFWQEEQNLSDSVKTNPFQIS